jgi:hypothetical protein
VAIASLGIVNFDWYSEAISIVVSPCAPGT